VGFDRLGRCYRAVGDINVSSFLVLARTLIVTDYSKSWFIFVYDLYLYYDSTNLRLCASVLAPGL